MTTNIGSIHIGYEIWEDGDMVTTLTVEGDIPVVTQLGLLRMAEDTILHPEGEGND